MRALTKHWGLWLTPHGTEMKYLEVLKANNPREEVMKTMTPVLA